MQRTAESGVWTMMRNIHNPTATTIDEVDSFCVYNLSAGPELNLIDWWHQNRQTFPYHFRLAMDILSIPCSSTSVERANSEAGREFSSQRLSLSSNMFNASMCVRSWAKNGSFFVPESRSAAANALKSLMENGHQEIIEDIEEVLEGGVVPFIFPVLSQQRDLDNSQ